MARFAGMNEHLMSCVLWSAMFFETSSDAECDPDVALKQLEQIAWHLRQMSRDDQRAFRTYAETTAATERRAEVATQIRVLLSELLPE